MSPNSRPLGKAYSHKGMKAYGKSFKRQFVSAVGKRTGKEMPKFGEELIVEAIEQFIEKEAALDVGMQDRVDIANELGRKLTARQMADIATNSASPLSMGWGNQSYKGGMQGTPQTANSAKMAPVQTTWGNTSRINLLGKKAEEKAKATSKEDPDYHELLRMVAEAHDIDLTSPEAIDAMPALLREVDRVLEQRKKLESCESELSDQLNGMTDVDA